MPELTDRSRRPRSSPHRLLAEIEALGRTRRRPRLADAIVALVHPWGSGGVYPNFPDPDLEDWAHACHGSNYDRLLRVKAEHDPDNFFCSPSRYRRMRRTMAQPAV